MRNKIFIVALLSVHNIITGCNLLPMAVNGQPLPKQESTIFPEHVMIKVSLLSTQENVPPIGIPPQANRDIGFATVFLSLENHQEQDQTVIIKKIEIQNASNNQSQPFHFERRQIELKPLENSLINIALSNKTGYVGQDRVKAIVTYQIGGEVNVIESEPVAVDRH